MTLVKTKPEPIQLKTYRSNGRKEELMRHLIESNVSVSTELRLEIINSNSALIKSITTEVEYRPVVIPADYFLNQKISLCDDNKRFLPEAEIYRQAKELGLTTPPAELALLIAVNPPSDHPDLSDLRNLAIMSNPKAKTDLLELTISLKHEKTFLDTVWKDTFQEVRHVFLSKVGLVFIRKNK